MRFQLVDMPPAPAREFDNEEAFVAACAEAGYTPTGVTSRASKYLQLRDQPTYKELHGPTPGHAGDQVRYETWAASAHYSRD